MQSRVESIQMGKPGKRDNEVSIEDKQAFGAGFMTESIKRMYAEGWRLVSTELEQFDKEAHGVTSVLFLFYEKE